MNLPLALEGRVSSWRCSIFEFDRTTINRFSGNFISSAEIKDACGGIDTLLYITYDFGSIKNSPNGIELSDNASPTTISIALLLADKVMNHHPLIISGSYNFKKSVINAAISDDLPISFADQNLPNLFIHQKDLIENMAHLSAKSHVEYINCEKAFAKRGACIIHAHHLPKWANDDPKKFFRAADKYEGCANRRYVEIEFALPNELTTVEQYKQIIAPFIDKHLNDHYYIFAIHEKFGALSNGQHHPHVHIM